MEGPNLMKADEAIKLPEGFLISSGGAKVIAGGKAMAGIQADADTLRVADQAEDPSHVLEAVSQAGPLA